MAIGDVRTQSNTINPAQATARPNDFGASIGQNLQDLGGAVVAFGQSRETLVDANVAMAKAANNRQNKAFRATADTDLIRFNAEMERDLADMRVAATEAGADDYHLQSEKFIRTKYAEFAKGLPDAIRDEYGARIEGAIQSGTTKAFNYSNEAATATYQRDVNKQLLEITNSILAGKSDMTQWAPEVDRLLANSTLTEGDTAALRLELQTKLQTAQYQHDANIAAVQSPVTLPNATADGSDVVAAGLPNAARPVLNAIASTEAPDYYTRNGGSKVTDLSDHPGKGYGPGGTSSAAGRYQFVYGTWKEAQAALNLPDFSPESQDKAAWWLAERDFNRRTKLDLQTELASGDAGRIDNVRKVLAGSGEENVTWQGLQGMSPAKFLEFVNGQSGSLGALAQNEAYFAVPHSAKVQMNAQAVAAANAQANARQQAQTAETNAAINEMQHAIADGKAGQADIEKASAQYNLTYAQEEKLNSQWQEKNAQRYGASQAAERQSANIAFDGSKKQSDDMNALYNETFSTGVRERDEQITAALVQSVAQDRYIAEGAAKDLTGMLNSPNQRDALSALETMNQMRQVAPVDFARAFDDATEKNVIAYANSALTPDQFYEQMREGNNKMNSSVLDMRDKQLAAIRKDDPEAFMAHGIANQLGLVIPDEGSPEGTALTREYNEAYDYFYGRLGNESKAHDAAGQQISARWGNTNVGSREEMMKYPPEKVLHEQYRGSWDYLKAEVMADFGYTADTQYRLVSLPNITDSAVNGGWTPAWGVTVQNDDGSWGLEQETIRTEPGDPVTSGEEILTGNPALIEFGITPQMRQIQVEETTWRNADTVNKRESKDAVGELEVVTNQIESLQSRQAMLPEADRNSPEVQDALAFAREQQRELQAEVEELESESRVIEAAKPETLDKSLSQIELIRQLREAEAETVGPPGMIAARIEQIKQQLRDMENTQ